MAFVVVGWVVLMGKVVEFAGALGRGGYKGKDEREGERMYRWTQSWRMGLRGLLNLFGEEGQSNFTRG